MGSTILFDLVWGGLGIHLLLKASVDVCDMGTPVMLYLQWYILFFWITLFVQLGTLLLQATRNFCPCIKRYLIKTAVELDRAYLGLPFLRMILELFVLEEPKHFEHLKSTRKTRRIAHLRKQRF